MAESANVTSVDAIARFRGAFLHFKDDAQGVLLNLDRQAQKMLHWIEGDATTYWRLQVLRCHEQISRARSALDTALMRKTKDYTPSCIEEKDNLRIAREKLRQAEEKTVVVRKWARLVREEIDEYRGKMNLLRDCLETDVPRGLALLERTLSALERYAEMAPPSVETNEPGATGFGDRSNHGDETPCPSAAEPCAPAAGRVEPNPRDQPQSSSCHEPTVTP